MQKNGIYAIFHYIPLHSSDMGKKFGDFNCPISNSVSERIVRLPFYLRLDEKNQEKIINKVQSFK